MEDEYKDAHLKEAFQKELEVFMAISDSSRMVLAFPPINSYSRLRLHELTKDKFPALA
jgi:hypothetical protein